MKNSSIDQVGLRPKLAQTLQTLGIKDVKDLARFTKGDLLSCRHLGMRRLRMIQAAAKKFGVSLLREPRLTSGALEISFSPRVLFIGVARYREGPEAEDVRAELAYMREYLRVKKIKHTTMMESSGERYRYRLRTLMISLEKSNRHNK